MLAARRVLSLVLLLAAACEKRAAPPPSEGLPPLSQAERARLPAKQALPEAEKLGQGDEVAAPSSAEAAAAPLDPLSILSGELRLSPRVKTQVAPGETIFLVARGAGQGAAPGPVLAVKKLVAGTFPQRFSLDNRDAMLMTTGTPLSGEVTLMARIDKDGDAMSKSPGDVIGSLKVKAPSRAVVLTLDTVLGP
jgi:cytochrome c-type biogenesis protein CcmH